jgi:hypothetical protein
MTDMRHTPSGIRWWIVIKQAVTTAPVEKKAGTP